MLCPKCYVVMLPMSAKVLQCPCCGKKITREAKA